MIFSLKKRKASKKDYSFHRSHKLGVLALPSELTFLSPILSQDAEDCTAFSAVATRDDEILNGNFDPMEFWKDELAFANDTTSQGYNLEVPAAVGVKIGFSPMGNPTLRQNKASAYFWITSGGQDLFDNIRNAIYYNQRPVMGGLDWYTDYNNSDTITKIGSILLGGHAIKIAGWTTKNGVPLLVLQNSWGTNIGDQGKFYMTREAANKAFAPYGIFYWSDSQDFKVKTLGLILALWINIKTLLHL